MTRQLRRTRIRLALLGTAIFMLVAAPAAAGVWLTFSHLRYANFDSTLAGQAQALAAGLQESSGQVSFDGGDSIPSETPGGIAVGVLIFDDSGHAVTRSGTTPAPALLSSLVQATLHTGHPTSATVSGGSASQRVFLMRMPSTADVSGVLAVSRTTVELEETLTLFGVLIGAVALGMTLLAGVLTYILAGRALRPMRVMTETLQQFTADAAHELRAPLALMRAELEVSLSKQRDAGAYQTSQRVVLREVERLSLLAEQLLTLAQADADALQLQLQPVDVADLIDETAARWQPLAQSGSVSLISEVVSDMTVRGDPALLRRLVDNLVDNAIRHTPASGLVKLSLSDGGNACTLVVSDTGPGVPADQRPSLFDRFTRGDPARGRDTGGAGLGLALCRVIAQLHGGSITLDDTRSGASFRVVLPATSE